MTAQAARTATARSRNRLLAAIPEREYEQLRPHLTPIDLEQRHPLWETNRPISSVYFPLTSVNSIIAIDDQGGEVEVGTVGNEGMVGLPVFLGSRSSPGRAFTQISGQAERMDVAVFLQHIAHDGALRRVLHLYTQGFVVQVSQTVACNRLHNPHRRLARWLLMCRDRMGRSEYQLTQEFMAQMLGVRRATVSEVAGGLKEKGLVDYRRGRVTIEDEPGLEREACECYRIVKNEFDRLLGLPYW